MKWVFPPEGWKVQWVKMSNERIAFDFHGCFILDRLTELGTPELTAIFCKSADILYEDVSATFIWERENTLGRGDDLCSFRFYNTTFR